jgi:hypothetical protein
MIEVPIPLPVFRGSRLFRHFVRVVVGDRVLFLFFRTRRARERFERGWERELARFAERLEPTRTRRGEAEAEAEADAVRPWNLKWPPRTRGRERRRRRRRKSR